RQVLDDCLVVRRRFVRARHVLQPRLETASREHPRQRGDRHEAAEDHAGAEQEDEDRRRHQRTSVTPSNMSGGRWMPDAFRRSQTFGRTPVARNRPTTLPSWVTPIFSKTKISCIVITSPSIPVISETLVTLRVPSLNRVCCTTIWMAAAI